MHPDYRNEHLSYFFLPDSLNPGCFAYRTSTDLLNKAEEELAELEADPLSSKLAFNLVVTISSWADWFFELEDSNPDLVNKLFSTDPELTAIRHLADHAKHWKAKKLKSLNRNVEGTAVATLIKSELPLDRYPSGVIEGAEESVVLMINIKTSSGSNEWRPLPGVLRRVLALLRGFEREGRASVEARVRLLPKTLIP
jgi:hypothetical protein